jgi:PST family polysaccharide transporter
VSRNDGIVRSASWLLVSRAIGDAGLLVYYLLLARTFGTAGIGDYSFAFAVASFLALGVGFGLKNLIVRRVSRDPEEPGEIAATVLLTQTAFAIVLAAALVAVTRAVGYSATLTGYLVLAFLALSLFAIGVTFIAFLEAVGAMYLSALASLIQKGTIVALGVVLILGGASLSTVMSAHVLAGAAYLIVGWWWARRHFGKFRLRYRPELARAVFIAALPFLATSALWEIYSRIDIVMLHVMHGDAETGLYASAYKLISAPLFVAALVGVAVFPTLARSAAEDRSEMNRVFRETMRALVVLGLAGGVLLITAGDGLQVMLFGEEFAESGVLVRLMAPLFVLQFLMVPLWRVLLAMNRERTLLLLRVVSVGINVGLNLLLIPVYGAKGAVASSLISEGLLALAQSILCVRIVPSIFGGRGGALVFVGLASVSVGLLARVLLPWPLVAVGTGVVFALLVSAFGLVTPTEIRQLLRAARLSPGSTGSKE